MAWILAVSTVTEDYGIENVFLLNALVGSPTWTAQWHFWFVEMLVYVLLAMTALLAVPALDRAERRWPFGLAAAVLAAGLLPRFGVVDFGIPHPMPVLGLFAPGWAARRARGRPQRLAVLAVALASVPGFFGDPGRDALILAGVLALNLVPSVRLPSPVARAAGVMATSSLYIYLVHWQVFPRLRDTSPVLAVVASLAAGLVAWLVFTRGAPVVVAVARAAVTRVTSVPIGRRLVQTLRPA